MGALTSKPFAFSYA